MRSAGPCSANVHRNPRPDAARRYGHAFSAGIVGALFAVTGPVAILLSVALDAGLDRAVVDSWILVAYVLGGGLSIVFSLRQRQPLALAWTICRS